MDSIRLLMVAFEHMFDGDVVEAVHALRTFADDLEEYGCCPDPQELEHVIRVLFEEEG